MTYWMQGVATNPTSAFVCMMSLGAAALVVLYAIQTVRASIKRLFVQAAFMNPHHIGVFSQGRSISPALFVIELRRAMVVGYATDIKDADMICQMSWFRNELKRLIIDDAQVWNGKTEIAAREAAASERIRFMNAMQNRDGILLDRTEAGAPLNFVMVDRDKRRLVKIGYT
jgi:hypothetical protein